MKRRTKKIRWNDNQEKEEKEYGEEKRERKGGGSWERGRGAYVDEIDEEEIETLRERAGPWKGEEGEWEKRESGRRGGAMEKEPNKK